MSEDKVSINRQDIVRQVCLILKPWLSGRKLVIQMHEDFNLLTDSNIDSVAILQLVLELEKRFNVAINEHELDSQVFSRMGNLIDMIEGKINEAD